MSKTVKIPSDRNPWTCNINGVPYSYTAGSTQSVPDEVAALIQQTYGFPPAPPKVEKPWPCDPVDLSAYEKIADAFTPTITSPSNGDVIKYDSSTSKWVNGAGGGGGGGAVVHLTQDADTGVITADVKAGELFAAAQSGGIVFVYTFMGNDIVEGMFQAILDDQGYTFITINNVELTAETANDYPATAGGAPS